MRESVRPTWSQPFRPLGGADAGPIWSPVADEVVVTASGSASAGGGDMVAVITVKSRAEVRKTIRVTVALRLRESLDEERTRRVRRTSLGDGVEFIGRSSRR